MRALVIATQSRLGFFDFLDERKERSISRRAHCTCSIDKLYYIPGIRKLSIDALQLRFHFV